MPVALGVSVGAVGEDEGEGVAVRGANVADAVLVCGLTVLVAVAASVVGVKVAGWVAVEEGVVLARDTVADGPSVADASWVTVGVGVTRCQVTSSLTCGPGALESSRDRNVLDTELVSSVALSRNP